MSGQGFYITGTDTGVGKTTVSVALVHALRAAARKTAGMKPVASGCVQTVDGWRNADALALQAASEPMPEYALVNPFALPAATAPSIAAAKAGITVSLPSIVAAYLALAEQADAIIVEGVGGWLAPLSTTLEQSELVRALNLPVILVVGLKLGCLNHARLSARAIGTDGLCLAGWVGSAVDPQLAFAEEYLESLHAALAVPCLGVLPHLNSASPAMYAAHLHLPV